MSEAGEDQGWGGVAEQILLGLAHDLNNRLLALMGIREMGEEGPLDDELMRLFDDELTRLGTASRLLRRLGESPGEPEPVEGAAFLETVRELHARNSGLRSLRTEWSVPAALPAVHVDPVAAARALLRVLASAGRAADDAAEPLRVRAGVEEGNMVVEISPAPPDTESATALAAAVASVRSTATGLRVRFHAL